MRVAVVGCGNIGSKRVLALGKDKQSKIKAIVGRKILSKKIDSLGYKISKKIKCSYYTNIDKILTKNIDAVILSTQPNVFLKFGKKNITIKKTPSYRKTFRIKFKRSKYFNKNSEKK